MIKVFIDGSAGTTGLKIFDRLSQRADIELIKIAEEFRKDLSARADAINSADVCFLCLPDDAAKEAVTLVKNDSVKLIDTSTAHRTNADWTYGFPELIGYDKIAAAKKIANPGCHASGFISLVAPLVKAGIINADAKLSCFSLTGYTGGGKKMIAQYTSEAEELASPRVYGITQNHKHLPEMQLVCGLQNAPIFVPTVAAFPQGMQVTVPLFLSDLCGGIEQIKAVYQNTYKGKIVFYDDCDESGFLFSDKFAGKDAMAVGVFGNEQRITLVSRFDNLGKGASGAAIQNMNVLLGLPEETGLVL